MKAEAVPGHGQAAKFYRDIGAARLFADISGPFLEHRFLSICIRPHTERRAKMGAVLQKIQKQAQSNDLCEVIDKALADSPSPA